jgi:hypothetical protein
MHAELRDSLEFLFADSPVSPSPCREMTLDVPRGGTIAVHLLLNDLPPGGNLRVSAGMAGARWFRLADVPVERNTGPVGFTETEESSENPYVIRRAPFRVYDAMAPLEGEAEIAAPTMALRLHVPVTADVPAGEREISLQVEAGGEAVELRVRVRVHAAILPPVGKDSFPYTNWFAFSQMATRHGQEPWSEGHWRMIAKYAALMAHGRQNMFWLPQGDIFTMRDGRPVLERERLRRLVKIFTDAGMHYIEGGHFGGRATGDWHCPVFKVGLTGSLAASAEGNADIHDIATQLMEEIERNGWRGRWIQHIADEPIDSNAADYRIFTGIVRKYMPGIPILDATLNEGLVGSVDIWCPQAQEFQRHQGHFAAMRALGDRVFFYTCCFPGGPWLNRLLDMELLRPALLGWGAARFGLDGFLHWGLNHYRADQDPFAKSVVRHGGKHFLPAGDTHVVYPGADGPWGSLRLEAQREGFEDLELLRLLGRRDPRRAGRVARMAVRGFDRYTRDVRVFRAARRALLAALEGR